MAGDDFKPDKTKFLASKRPLLYSINVQTAIILMLALHLCLLSPFPTSKAENVTLNFLHDFIYQLLDRVQVISFDKQYLVLSFRWPMQIFHLLFFLD